MDSLKVLIALLLGFGITKTTSLSTSVSENGNFTISTAATDWISSCKRGKPALVNVHWNTLSLDGDIPIPENGSRVWIGYYRQYQYFSVKGCASAGSGGTRIGNIDNPLGHCFYLCNHLSLIGLAGAMCYCLSDDYFNALPSNNATCSYETCGSGLVCGNNRTMWVYGVEKKIFSSITTASKSVEGKCVSLTKSLGASWRADQCSQSNRALCMENDGTVDAKEAAVPRGVTWDAALKICHDKLETLANISHENFRSVILNQHIPDFYTGWTSFVRDMVVGTGGFDKNLTDLADCAVIYKSDGKIKLDYQDCKNIFPAVCLNELQSTSTVTSTTTSTTNMSTTGTTEAHATTGSTTPSTSFSSNLQTASTTKVTKTRTIQPTTSERHAAAAGNISTDTSATRSIEFGIITTTTTTATATTNTTTSSTAQSATRTSNATESITPRITILPSTVTAPKTFTIPVASTVEPMPKGSTSTTGISLGQPKTDTTTIFNRSTRQPTTSTSLTSTTNSIPTWTLATSSTRVGTATVSITQGANNVSSTAVFPMTGRIGLGIGVIVVVAGAVVVIKKMTAKRKRRPSTQTSAHSHDNKTELPKGIPMLGVNEKEVSSNDDENEIKMKGTSNGCSKEGNVATDPNYECVQIESNIKHSNGPVGNSTGQTDNAHSTNCQYATVVKVGKGSPKITKTTPESDTNTYDTTYVHQEKNRDTGDAYQHIYDHANFKNPE